MEDKDGDLEGELAGDFVMDLGIEETGDLDGDFIGDFTDEAAGDFSVADLTDDEEGEGDIVGEEVETFLLTEVDEGSFCLYANNDSLGLGGGVESFFRALLKYVVFSK